MGAAKKGRGRSFLRENTAVNLSEKTKDTHARMNPFIFTKEKALPIFFAALRMMFPSCFEVAIRNEHPFGKNISDHICFIILALQSFLLLHVLYNSCCIEPVQYTNKHRAVMLRLKKVISRKERALEKTLVLDSEKNIQAFCKISKLYTDSFNWEAQYEKRVIETLFLQMLGSFAVVVGLAFTSRMEESFWVYTALFDTSACVAILSIMTLATVAFQEVCTAMLIPLKEQHELIVRRLIQAERVGAEAKTTKLEVCEKLLSSFIKEIELQKPKKLFGISLHRTTIIQVGGVLLSSAWVSILRSIMTKK